MSNHSGHSEPIKSHIFSLSIMHGPIVPIANCPKNFVCHLLPPDDALPRRRPVAPESCGSFWGTKNKSGPLRIKKHEKYWYQINKTERISSKNGDWTGEDPLEIWNLTWIVGKVANNRGSWDFSGKLMTGEASNMGDIGIFFPSQEGGSKHQQGEEKRTSLKWIDWSGRVFICQRLWRKTHRQMGHFTSPTSISTKKVMGISTQQDLHQWPPSIFHRVLVAPSMPAWPRMIPMS